MKLKILASILLTMFLLAGFVSAASFTLDKTSLDFIKTGDTGQFKITNTDLVNLDVTAIPTNIASGSSAGFSVSGNLTGITNTTPQTITVTFDSISSSYLDDLEIGIHKLADLVLTSGTTNKTITLNIDKPFCEIGDIGSLNVKRVNYDVTGFGDDDEWYALDSIEVEVRVENKAEFDIDNIIVAWGLYNKQTGEFIIDEEEDDFDLEEKGEDDEDTVTFSFVVDPNELTEDDGEDDFAFYVKAYSDDLGEDQQCNSYKKDIKMIRDKHFVVLGDIDTQETAQCGSDLEVRAEVWNIGDEDEKDVYVVISNTELKINQRIDIGDVDILENKDLSAIIAIPSSASEKSYNLRFEVYDEDSDIFQNENDDEAVFLKSITVQGNCGAAEEAATAQIIIDSNTAIQSGGKAGEDVIIKASLENTGDEEATYTIQISGYQSWAIQKTISPQSLTLDAGESRDIFITLEVNADASGEQSFTITALFDSKSVDEQLISVPIESAGGVGITGASIFENLGENWFIWVIVAINVVLIVAIIIVASRLAK